MFFPLLGDVGVGRGVGANNDGGPEFEANLRSQGRCPGATRCLFLCFRVHALYFSIMPFYKHCYSSSRLPSFFPSLLLEFQSPLKVLYTTNVAFSTLNHIYHHSNNTHINFPQCTLPPSSCLSLLPSASPTPSASPLLARTPSGCLAPLVRLLSGPLSPLTPLPLTLSWTTK